MDSMHYLAKKQKGMDRTTFRKLCDMLHIHEGFRPSKNMEMDEKCNLEKEGNIILMNIDMTRGDRKSTRLNSVT